MNHIMNISNTELSFNSTENPFDLKMCSSRTIRSNKTAANNFREYLREKGIDDRFERFEVPKLNKSLGNFYINARQADGTHYKVNSLENFRYGLNRYLKSAPYFRKIDIIKDSDFCNANQFFKAAITELKRLGKGDVEHHPVITSRDLKDLYESAHFDPSTPSGLLNKVQFDIRMYFFRRGMENMSKMTKSTFSVMKDPETGLKVVVKVDEFGCNPKENQSDNITGVMPECVGSRLCPVKSFQMYISKLHPDCDRLWQRPRENSFIDDEIWFCRSAVGEKNLAKFMSGLSKTCLLSTTYTNHSIRATGAAILRKYFEPSLIMTVMGQKSASYLSGYQRISNKEKISMGQAITSNLSNGQSPTPVAANHFTNQDKGSPMVTNSDITTKKSSSQLPKFGAVGQAKGPHPLKLSLNKKLAAPDHTWLAKETPTTTPTTTIPRLQTTNSTYQEKNKTIDLSGIKRSALTPENLRPSKVLRRYFTNQNERYIDTQKKPRFPTTMTISKAESELLREISTQRISPSPPASAPTIAEDFTVELVEHELEEEEEEEEQQLIISEHQHNVMASLASLWRNGRLCDAAIGNGTSKILVHKIVLLAICPRLLSMFSADVQTNRFLQVNFPQRVSEQALSAFAEYMYNGVLRLTPRLLDQLRLIALQLGIKELELLCDANSVFSQNTRLTSVTHSSLSNSQPTGQFVRSVPVHHQRQSNLLHRQQQFLNPSSIDNQEIIVIPDSQEIIIEDQIPQQFCYSSLPLDVQETSYQASDAGIGNLIATSKQARSIKHDSIEEYRPEETIKIEHDDTDDEKYDQLRPTQMRGTLASVFNSLTNELITHITHPDQTEMNVSSSSHQHPHTPNFSSEKSSVNFPSAVSNRSQVQQKRLDRNQSLRDISIKNEDTGQQDSNQDYRHKVTPTDHNPDTHHLAKLAPFTLEKSMDLEMLPEPEVEFIQITDVRSGSRNSAIS